MITLNEFEKMVMNDHKNIFLNVKELGQTHNLNGTECIASVQALTDKDRLVQQGKGFDGIEGQIVNVFVTSYDLPEKPVNGQLFKLDGEIFYVQEVIDNYSMLKITLGANRP